MEQRILVIGSLNMDMVVNVEQMPLRGETIMGKSLAYVPGGKGANQACAAGKLGKNVAMLGCIGDDANGSILRDSLSARRGWMFLLWLSVRVFLQAWQSSPWTTQGETALLLLLEPTAVRSGGHPCP